MVEKPQEIIKNYFLPKTEMICVHAESRCNFIEIFHLLKRKKIKCGIAINPNTEISILNQYLKYIDLVLLMSVNPGKGGQKFIINSLEKLNNLKKSINRVNKNLQISVDGGVDKSNSTSLINNGCDILVSGSYLIKSSNLNKTINSLLNR